MDVEVATSFATSIARFLFCRQKRLDSVRITTVHRDKECREKARPNSDAGKSIGGKPPPLTGIYGDFLSRRCFAGYFCPF